MSGRGWIAVVPIGQRYKSGPIKRCTGGHGDSNVCVFAGACQAQSLSPNGRQQQLAFRVLAPHDCSQLHRIGMIEAENQKP